MLPLIEDGAVVLFQGDSITDAGRNWDDQSSMGQGYAMMVGAWFSALYPERKVRFINKGISDNRVKDLQARWEKDCLDLQPNWVSILIGINDVWRRYDSNDATTAESYEEGYRDILEQTKSRLGARLIILEPFVLPVPEDRRTWREDLDPKIAAVRKLAVEYGAVYVPLDGIFAQACTQREAAFWAGDGVHPTQEGHALIAQSWLRAMKAL